MTEQFLNKVKRKKINLVGIEDIARAERGEIGNSNMTFSKLNKDAKSHLRQLYTFIFLIEGEPASENILWNWTRIEAFLSFLRERTHRASGIGNHCQIYRIYFNFLRIALQDKIEPSLYNSFETIIKSLTEHAAHCHIQSGQQQNMQGNLDALIFKREWLLFEQLQWLYQRIIKVLVNLSKLYFF